MPQDYDVLEPEPETDQTPSADYKVLEPEPVAPASSTDYTVLEPEPTPREAKGASLRSQLAALRTPGGPSAAELGEWALTGVRDFYGNVVSGILNAPVAFERKVGLLPPETLLPTEVSPTVVPPEVISEPLKRLGYSPGFSEEAGRFGAGFTTPEMLPFAALPYAGPVVKAATAATFGGLIASDVPEAARQAGELSVTGTEFEKEEAGARLGFDIALPAWIAKELPQTAAELRRSDVQLPELAPGAERVTRIGPPWPARVQPGAGVERARTIYMRGAEPEPPPEPPPPPPETPPETPRGPAPSVSSAPPPVAPTAPPSPPPDAAAKAQAEVSKTAATEGKRSAKEVKDELVARLEAAIKEAPSEHDAVSAAIQTAGAKVETGAAKFEEQKKAVYGGKQVPQVTFDIPGDGTFTVWNTKENLQGLLARAKRISTSATEGPRIKRTTQAVPLDAGEWVQSSEPTHDVSTFTTVKDRPATLLKKGRPVTIKGHEDKTLWLTATKGGEFSVTEPRTGLSVGSGDTAQAAIANAEGRLTEAGNAKYQEALAKHIEKYGEQPPPKPIEVKEEAPPPPPEPEEGGPAEARAAAIRKEKQSTLAALEEQLKDIARRRKEVRAQFRGVKPVSLMNRTTPRIERGQAFQRALDNLAIEERGIPEQIARLRAELAEPEAPAEARIPRPGTREAPPADIFTMSDGDLRDYLADRFPEPERPPSELPESRRPGTYEFPSYDAFKAWMDARYAERDLEGMRLAFAEAPVANKVAYIKGNRGDAHKEAWIRHLATGSVLPAESPPVPRTTPRPLPGGGAATPPTGGAPPGGAPPAHQQPPPPPPRAPTVHRKFDITALVQLLRQFERFPRMNERLKRAYGRLIPSKELVELKSRLLWDTDLAERVLGHEIGHFIDLLVPIIGKGKQFGQRLRLLTDFAGQAYRSKELRADAKSLSRQWRGSFTDGDPYRDTARELIADFMSAMFHDPEWVNQQYPRLYDAFSEFRTAKPAFDSAYREIETWLQGDTVSHELLAQDRSAVSRTFDIITKPPEKRPFAERLKLLGDQISQSLISLWGRAFQKEGKPRRIGTSVTEKLDTSYMWGAKKTFLWSDRFTKEVQPHLDRVDPDPTMAHAYLLAYSKAVRTIGERRAAGVWIEQHPAEAHALLEHLLSVDPALHAKFVGALTPDLTGPQLYDLSAQIFREIHDRGDRFVARMAREIDGLNLGVGGDAALVAFNVRGKLLNPGGQTPANAQRMIAHLRDQLGPQRFAELEAAARTLRGLMAEVQREMYDAGLISKSAWDNLIAPNTDNYLPYAVLDYFDGRVKAGILKQVGTAKDVADIAAATQLKVGSAYTWLQKQRQVQLVREAYARGGVDLPIGERLRRASDIDAIRSRKEHLADDVSRDVIWVDGQPHLMEFPGDPGKLLQQALELPSFYEHMQWVHTLSRFTHNVMQFFTQWNPRFLFYRNIIRGARTAALKVGFGRTAQQWSTGLPRNYALARNYANAAFGEPLLPEVRRMVELEALPPPHIALGAVRDLPNMREMLLQGAMPVFSAKRLVPLVPERQLAVREGLRKANRFLQKVFTGYEAFEKIYNYQAALEKGLGEETATAIAQRGGIPRPGVSGKWMSAAEIFFPWSRVRLQGIRASGQMLRDPRFNKAFLARFVITEALPRMAKVFHHFAMAYGLSRLLMRKDEDKNDPVWGEVARRVSPYKMALDDVVPLAFYDARTGQYHPFWEFKSGKSVPAHFEVVSIRIPASEEGQTFGNAFYTTLVSMPGLKEQLGRPGQGPVEAVTAAAEAMGPQLSPVLSTLHSLREMILKGRNPADPWYGSPSANPRLFDAGGVDRAQAIAGYVMNQAGGPGELAAVLAANVGLLDDRARQALSYRLSSDKRPWPEKFPWLGAVASYDNYAQYRDEKTAQLTEDMLRAKGRLVMPPAVADMYDFYYRNIKRQAKLDPQDAARFEIAREFVTKVWGSATQEGSFYGRAAHALSPDGSKESRETIRRDLMTATESLRAAWDETSTRR